MYCPEYGPGWAPGPGGVAKVVAGGDGRARRGVGVMELR